MYERSKTRTIFSCAARISLICATRHTASKDMPSVKFLVELCRCVARAQACSIILFATLLQYNGTIINLECCTPPRRCEVEEQEEEEKKHKSCRGEVSHNNRQRVCAFAAHSFSR